jgi:hypothetical protein
MGLKWAELGLLNQVGRFLTHIFNEFAHVFDQVCKDFQKTTFCSKLGQITCISMDLKWAELGLLNQVGRFLTYF